MIGELLEKLPFSVDARQGEQGSQSLGADVRIGRVLDERPQERHGGGVTVCAEPAHAYDRHIWIGMVSTPNQTLCFGGGVRWPDITPAMDTRARPLLVASVTPPAIERYRLGPSRFAHQPRPYGRLVRSSSAISISRLYFATRSPRAGAPFFICPAPVPTARSAINESSVSPDR